MDDSDKGLFSSSTATIKPSAIPKFLATGRPDENTQNCDKMVSKMHSLLKKSPIKHFMSPTVSAASKASAPRNKVLVERNEALNSTQTHHNNTTNLYSKISPLCSTDSSVSNRVTPVQRRGSESDDDEQNTCVSDSSLAYDPLTNYLSPRPKFLRYKPDRRREIFLGEENEIGKENVASGVKSHVRLDSQRGFVKQEDGENMTGNEQDEGSGVKSSACLASQRNISKEEKVPSSEEGIVDQKDEKINELNGDHQEDDSDEEIEELEKENYSVLKNVMEFLLVIGILFLSTIYICSMNSPSPSLTSQALGHLKYGYHRIQNYTSEVDFLEGRSLSFVQTEGMQYNSSVGFEEEAKTEGNIKGLVESADKLVEVVDVEITVGFPPEENAESEEVLDQLKGIELSKTTEKSEYVQVEVEDKAETIKVVFDDGVEKEVVEIKMEERVEEGLTKNADGISKGEVDLVMEFLLVLVMAALSLLGFHFWRKKTSLSIEKPLSESILADKTTSVGPVVIPYVEEEHVEKVESFVNPSSSLLRSTEEEFYQIRAPTVELLGEFVVGEVSSSIKSCGMKSKMMEVEVSTSSIFQEKGTGSKAHVFSSPVKPSASEFSTMNSPSYGSFTAQKKISKKEEGTEGEVKSAAATTVRRSSRLRSRAVMSP
ncbi:uncharacterized protein LOC131309883 isoform X2 [Rhododendron vialii]|uniref:uncharacterized protein LOC131309883 isoform X2 n=1 Tax=Rhododendron vialii TaxID=182163 RepID=UPI00265ECA5B|nr:uncharacterized protein LOC131309883 isoform X2 [Rhododendron vialii]